MAQSNKQVIETFYSSFSNNDPDKMVNCYHEDVTFEDPAFGLIEGDRAKNMWRMLLFRGGKDMKVTYKNIETEADTGTAEWEAKYLFGANKRKVTNNIKAHFKFKEGKIIEHRDEFPIWKWSRQAIGVPGLFLGWTGLFRNKMQASSNRLLDAYIEKTSS